MFTAGEEAGHFCGDAKGPGQGVGKKLLLSSAAHTGREQKAALGKRAGVEQAVTSPHEGKRGRALTLGLTSVSGLL